MRYAAAIICILIFLALAAAMISGATLPVDVAVRRAVHGVSSNDLTTLAQFFSFIGSAPIWVTATFIMMLLLCLMQRRKQALTIGATMLGAILLDNGLKFLFHRARPEVFFGVSPNTYSFPSGHALFATCFYGALVATLAAEFKSALWRAALWSGAALMVLSVGWSRIYLGDHFPSDVLAGYLIGAAWLTTLGGVGAMRFAGVGPTQEPSDQNRHSG